MKAIDPNEKGAQDQDNAGEALNETVQDATENSDERAAEGITENAGASDLVG